MKELLKAAFKVDYPGFNLDIDLQLPASGITVVFGLSLIHISEPTRPY